MEPYGAEEGAASVELRILGAHSRIQEKWVLLPIGRAHAVLVATKRRDKKRYLDELRSSEENQRSGEVVL